MENLEENETKTMLGENERIQPIQEDRKTPYSERAEVAEEEKIVSEDCLQMKDKYLRLLAEFDNYKKRILKDKGELLKYGNESLLVELLPILDNLEMALKHSGETSQGIAEGVAITQKEFLRVMERFGVKAIEALLSPFDPALHHAMTRVERDDVDENTVIEEFRKGYLLNDKVIRPSLVAVSKKTTGGGCSINNKDNCDTGGN